MTRRRLFSKHRGIADDDDGEHVVDDATDAAHDSVCKVGLLRRSRILSYRLLLYENIQQNLFKYNTVSSSQPENPTKVKRQ